MVTSPVLTSSIPASSESEYLRTLIEKQPSCLMRVAIPGTMLAVNDAALGLLGGTDLGVVLGRSITERFVPEHIFDWPDFANRVWTHGAASLECELIDLTGAKRTALFQGVALRDHPDAIDSVLVVVRDTSTTHRLEQTLQADENIRSKVEEATAQLTEAVAEQQRLAKLLADTDGERQRAADLLAEREADRQNDLSRVEGASAQLMEALAEQQRLAALLADAESGRQRAADLLQQREAERERLDAEHAADRIRLQTTAEEQQLTLLQKDRETRDLLAVIQTQLSEVSADRGRLQALVEQQQLALMQQDRETRDLLTETQAQLADVSAERGRLQTTVEQHEADRTRADADAAAERAQFVADQQNTASRLALQGQELHDVREQLARAVGERLQLAATAQQQVIELQQSLAQKDQEYQSRLANLEQRVTNGLNEQERLTQILEQQDMHHRELLDTHAALTEAEQGLREQHERALAARDRTHEEAMAAWQAQLNDAVADQRRLQQLLAESESQQMQLSAERSAALGRTQQALDEAIVERDQILKQLADQHVDLQHSTESARSLESLAATGRLARDVGRELSEIVNGLQERSKDLLELSSLDDARRQHVETLRRDALRAVTLARQFVMLPDAKPLEGAS